MALTVPIDEIVARNANGLLGGHETWKRVRLGEVATIQNGAAFRSSYFNRDDRGLPLLRIRDVLRDRTEVFYDGPFDSDLIVDPGDLVIGMDGEFKCATWSGPRALLNQRVCRIHINDTRLDLRFLRLVLQGYLDAINDATPSVTVKHLSSRTLAELPLPLPSLSEQERLVHTVNGYLEQLDAADNGLVRASISITQYRHAAYSQAILKGKELPLGELLATIEAGRSLRCLGRPAELAEWGVIKVSAMTWGRFREDENKALPPGEQPDASFEIETGNLLLSRANTSTYVGASVLVEECRPKLLLSDKSLRLVPVAGIDPRWLHFALSAPTVRAKMSVLATGTKDSMRNISQAKLKSVSLPVPATGYQRSVADAIHGRLLAAARLCSEVEERRQQLVALRRAIMVRAVQGGLSRR